MPLDDLFLHTVLLLHRDIYYHNMDVDRWILNLFKMVFTNNLVQTQHQCEVGLCFNDFDLIVLQQANHCPGDPEN